MKIYTITVEWNQGIQEQFAQDDIKCIGHRRVETQATVVAPDRELAELFLLRSLNHREPKITNVAEAPIHIFVEASGRTVQMIPAGRVIGPEVLNRFGEAMKAAGHL